MTDDIYANEVLEEFEEYGKDLETAVFNGGIYAYLAGRYPSLSIARAYKVVEALQTYYINHL